VGLLTNPDYSSEDGDGLVRLVEQLGRLYLENTDEDICTALLFGISFLDRC
jgi:hypothetical protein